MTDKIKPALTAEEWERVRQTPGGAADYDDAVGDSPETRAYLIALNNDALPDSDPRKITRADVDNLRGILSGDAWAVAKSDIRWLAAALESYLPPETDVSETA